MNKKKRILFVDDDPNLLAGLRRTLRPMLGEWDMAFVTGSDEALLAMSRTAYQVIVSDIRMPGKNGVQLLEEIKEKFPNTIRLALSGYTDQQLVRKSARCVHQLLTKPCDVEDLKKAITRALALHQRMYCDSVTKVVSNLKSLPAMPATYKKVVDLLSTPDSSLRQVGKLIASDIAMSAKMLQVVNSAYYGLRHRITDPVHAVVYLGAKTAQALVLTSGVFSKLEPEKVIRFGADALQHHCIRTGGLAKAICESRGMDKKAIDEATMAGILHDVGKIILIAKMPEQFARAIQFGREHGISLHRAERELLGTTHAELGGYLMGLWDLPAAIVETAAFHHEPQLSEEAEFSLLTAVHIADAIDHQLCSSLADAAPAEVNAHYLADLDALHELAQWERLHLPLLKEHESVSVHNG